MMGDPWLSIVGLNEDSAAGMPAASRAAIDAADVIFGGPRHLELAGAGERGRAWPIPFSVEPVLACRDQRVVVLASGDPFWYGAGGSLVKHLDPHEWQCFTAPSTFTLAAATLGWRMEEITCHGLHAAPYARLRRILAPSARMICLVRDAFAPAELAQWLTEQDCGAAELVVMERLGGPRERIRTATASGFDLTDIQAPVAVAVTLPKSAGFSRASGLPDDIFAHDGQITKCPVRALTLSALAPRPGEVLWDIGAGSGSVSVEWCLAGGSAFAFERRPDRIPNIQKNADDFGIAHRMQVIEVDSARADFDQPLPDAVFIGGGANKPLLETILPKLRKGTRLVINGVTLETESLLHEMHSLHGGTLLRVELAQAAPLGTMRGWTPARPVVQWSVVL